jgi:hypothetical protein
MTIVWIRSGARSSFTVALLASGGAGFWKERYRGANPITSTELRNLSRPPDG